MQLQLSLNGRTSRHSVTFDFQPTGVRMTLDDNYEENTVVLNPDDFADLLGLMNDAHRCRFSQPIDDIIRTQSIQALANDGTEDPS
jgi:hypothetical protein